VHFEKNCGADDVCHSNLKVHANFGNLENDPTGTPVFKVGQVDVLKLNVMVENLGEDAHETTLTLLLPSAVSYIGTTVSGKDKSVSCGLQEDTSEVLCALGNPMVNAQQARFTVRLSGRDLSAADKQIIFSLRVNT